MKILSTQYFASRLFKRHFYTQSMAAISIMLPQTTNRHLREGDRRDYILANLSRYTTPTFIHLFGKQKYKQKKAHK